MNVPRLPLRASLVPLVLAALAAAPAPASAVFDGADDVRTPSIALDRLGAPAAPSVARRAATRALVGARATFNRYGTPSSLAPTGDGVLARGLPGADAVARARAFVLAERGLFGLDAGQVADLEPLHDRPLGDHGRAVLLRQRFGDLPAGAGTGQIAIALRDDDVLYASSTLAPTRAEPEAATLTASDALERATRGLGARGADVAPVGTPALVALPRSDGSVRPAFRTIVVDPGADGTPTAATTYVDARTGELLQRTDEVDQAADDPEFGVFPNTPPLDDASASDTRQRWCSSGQRAAGCDRVIRPGETPERTGAWDTLQPTGADGAALSTGLTAGNAARSEDGSEATPLAPGGTLTGAPITTPLQRDFFRPAAFTNAWRRAGCNPAGFADPSFPDVNAAEVNLFAAHNRMHDYAYRLGFTEAAYNLQVSNFDRGGRPLDPELGNVQAGATVGTVEQDVPGRDNANQIALMDGVPGITNMYLWQPLAGAFYGVCADGDFDMSIVGHEYTHAISNRMVGGPDAGLDTTEGGSMGESFSDLVQLEYLMSHGFDQPGASPYAVGAYVTGNRQRGIRDFSMDPELNPLNYSDLGFDLTGVEVHADGEVWNAVNMQLRREMQQRYDAQFPSSDRALQVRCADEDGVDPATCPGDRRYLQIMFDAFLLMQPDVSMVSARDAYLAADRARFGGADQDVIWDAFARRGLGEDAAVDPQNLDPDFEGTDVAPTPSFSSPVADDDVQVTFAPSAPDAELFVGDFEARVTPVADTVAGTTRDDVESFRPGTYDFVARADGYGARHFTATIPAGGPVRLEVPMAANLASANAGATIAGEAAGPAGDPLDPTAEPGDPAALLRGLVDDSEATNWANVVPDGSVAGTRVTVDLAGGEQTVGSVDVSALLRAQDPNDAGGDTVAQNRFTALRQFALEACTAGPGQDCSSEDAFTRFYESPADAFPGVRPRPAAPDLTLRSFDVPDTRMTHLRMVVLTNQCTGGPDFQGDQDDDPLQDSDCPRGSDRDLEVRAAELQVRGADAPAPVAVVPGPGTAEPDPGTTPTPTTPAPGTITPAPGTTTPALGTPGTGGASTPGAAATPCVDATGFRSIAVGRATGRRLRVGFATAAAGRRVDVDVFAVSRGRLVLGERLVARFRGRPATFTWDGRATTRRRVVRDGYYVVRLRTPNATGSGADIRRVALRRSGGRFTTLAAFQDRARCGLLRAAKLERPVFGGSRSTALGVSFAVAPPAAVTVEVLRGTRVVRTARRGTVGAATTQRLRVPSARLPRGTYRVRITAVRGGVREVRTLTARRLQAARGGR